MTAKPTVGRIVHFFNQSLPAHANNGIGAGPYAAIVTQTFTTGPCVNLKVLPYGDAWDEGSVSEKEKAEGSTRYWTWPAREEPISIDVILPSADASPVKVEPFTRPECIFRYCPTPTECGGACQCHSGS